MTPFEFIKHMRRGQAAILLAGIAAIVAMAILSYRAIDRELTQSALSRRSALSFLAATLLTEKFDRLVDIGVSLASRVHFRELVEAGKWGEAVDILREVPVDFPFIDRITINNLEGTLVADVPSAPGLVGRNFSHRDWHAAVVQSGRPYISKIYTRTALPRANVFVATVPVRNRAGDMSAILVLQVRADRFFEWVKNVDVGRDGLIYVVDREAKVASHPQFRAAGELIDYSGVPVVQKMMQGLRGIEVAAGSANEGERIVAYEPVAKYGWGVALEQPADAVFAARDEQRKQILFAYGTILLLIALCAELASRVARERGRAQAALARQATILQSIMDNMGDGVAVADENMRVLLINPVARRIIGLGPLDPPPANWATVEGRFLPDMVTPFPPERLFISRALRGENVDDEEVFIRNRRFPDGLWISGSARPVRIEGVVRQAVVVWRDITERRRAAGQIKELNIELAQHAEELETTNKDLESFSYSISHDLRSPLRAIDGYAKMLEDGYKDRLDGEGRRLLDVVRGNCHRMALLIDDLLEFSRLGRRAIAAAGLDMNSVLREAIRDVRDADPGAKVQIVAADLPRAWGDRALLKQVWINLLTNAIKFSARTDQPVIEIAGSTTSAENIYRVTDHGAGFDMQYYNKLFGVFQRLHSSKEFSGTGVGLAIVQRVINRHGGRVWAEGKVNAGATFYFTLPLEDSDGNVNPVTAAEGDSGERVPHHAARSAAGNSRSPR